MNQLITLSNALASLYAAGQTQNAPDLLNETFPLFQMLLRFDRGIIGIGNKIAYSDPDLLPVLAGPTKRSSVGVCIDPIVSDADRPGQIRAYNGTTALEGTLTASPDLKKIVSSFTGRMSGKDTESLAVIYQEDIEGTCAWIAFTRSSHAEFTPAEMAIATAVWPHLLRNYKYSLERWLDRSDDVLNSRAAALIGTYGAIVVSDPCFKNLIGLEWPSMPVDRLSEQVVIALESKRVYIGERIVISVHGGIGNTYLVCRAARNKLPETLAATEKAVAHYLNAGLDYRSIATEMGSSPNTIRTQIARIYKKLRISSREELRKVGQAY